jgi:PadR family transcriptional regulator PadR
MLTELRRHGYDASPGTLYPLLHRMERHGWLRMTTSPGAAVHEPHTYEITVTGAEVLAKVSKHVAELHAELTAGPTPSDQESHGPRGKRRNE